MQKIKLILLCGLMIFAIPHYTMAADTDGDGIEDIQDLDDDNDGIRDTVECLIADEAHDSFDANLGEPRGRRGGAGQITSNSVDTQIITSGTNVIRTVNGWTTFLARKNERTGVITTYANPNAGNWFYVREPGVGSGNNNLPDEAHSGDFYMDIGNNAIVYQEFTLAEPTILSTSAWFAQRENGRWTTQIEVYPQTQPIVGGTPIAQGQVATMIGFDAPDTWFLSEIVDQPLAPGDYRIQFYVSNAGHFDDVKFCFSRDSDGDGVPDTKETDSDNDGCVDALEGGQSFTPLDLVSNTNLCADASCISSDATTLGIPTQAGTGQSAGSSQTAAKMTITQQPDDEDATVGDSVTFDVTSTAFQTNTHNAGVPDYTAQTPATGVTYQWYKSVNNGTDWTPVAAPQGTAENLVFSSVTFADAGLYKRAMVCVQNSCDVETDEVTLNVNRPPTAVDDALTFNEDAAAMTGNVLTNDSDPDNDTLNVASFTVTGVTGSFNPGQTATIPNVGTLTISSNGTFTFSPVQHYNGTVPTATVTVTDNNGGEDDAELSITVTPVNDAPVAQSAVLGDLVQGQSSSVPLDGSDVEDPKPSLIYVIVSLPPANQAQLTYTKDGTKTILQAGTTLTAAEAATVIITPLSNYIGEINDLVYRVSDTQSLSSENAVIRFGRSTSIPTLSVLGLIFLMAGLLFVSRQKQLKM